jgi:hypothetical protein
MHQIHIRGTAVRLFHYDPETLLFVGEGVAHPNPVVEGEYLIPAFTTGIEPPTTSGTQQAIFKDGEWLIVTPPDPPKRTVEKAREDKLAEIKGEARRLLNQDDIKVQRHMEQVAIGHTTSIKTEDYLALLKRRQEIRTRSNTMEAELKNLQNKTAKIDAYLVRY